MRVLVVPTWYPSGEDKLMGIYHKEFTSALNKYGIETDILYIDRQRLSKPFKYITMKKKVIEIEENYNVYKYRTLNLGPIGFDIQMKHYTKRMKSALRDYLKDNPRPDIIHAMVSVPAGYACLEAGKSLGIPVLVTEHGGNLERFYRDEPYKKYGLKVLESARMSVVSNYMKDIVLKYTPTCDVLPNQVNTDLFKNDIKRKIGKSLNIVSVCALREGKRLDIAFKAIKKLIDEGMEIHYDIIGDGFYENIYKNAAREIGVEDHVTFLGRMSKSQIAKKLLDEHILLISSELESFAIPGVEALASGLPVVTTDCKGPVEFVSSECGAICKVNDPDDMAASIKKVYANYDSYKKEKLVRVADRYSEESVIKQAKNIYESITCENK